MKIRPEDFTQFKLSKPWGYYPPAVEEKIKQYETIIRELSDKFLEEKQKNMSLIQKIEQLQDELREMHLQMSSLELPEAVEAIEHFVLDDFKNYNSSKFDSVQEPNIVENKYNENEIKNQDDDNGDSPFIIVK